MNNIKYKKYIVKKNRPHLQKCSYFRNQDEKHKSTLTAKIAPGVSVRPWNQSHAEEWHSRLWKPVLVPGCSVHGDGHTADTCAQAETLVCDEIGFLRRSLGRCKRSPSECPRLCSRRKLQSSQIELAVCGHGDWLRDVFEIIFIFFFVFLNLDMFLYQKNCSRRCNFN